MIIPRFKLFQDYTIRRPSRAVMTAVKFFDTWLCQMDGGGVLS